MTTPVAPYWDEIALPAYPRLDRDVDADVVVVGAGLTGITTAYLLGQLGCRVAVLERARVGGVDSACTTAHLATVTDARLTELARTIGRDHAQAVWDAGWAAIHQIERLVAQHGIECGFTWLPGYLHAPFDADEPTLARERQTLREEAELADDLEFDAEYIERAPVVGTPAMRVEHQARFHPRAYLAGLLAHLAPGVSVFEHSDATVTDIGASCHGHTIRAPWVVMATHNPLPGRQGFLGASVLQTRLALFTSYAVRARLAKPVDEALYWDTSDPYRYLRFDRIGDDTFVIAGGEDHKTGQVDDTAACFRTLEAWLDQICPGATVTHRWSGQVIETPDLLPVIGETAEKQIVATGFAGNGMTFGTLSAMIVHDAVAGTHNPWRELFDINRSAAARGPWRYVTENVDYPYYMVRDRFAGARHRSLRSLKPNEAEVLSLEGQAVAAHRDANGRLHTVSAVCTHLGCRVHWNTAEQTWDCPCHGSRFTPTGEVISGPAERPLPAVDVSATSSS